MRLLVDTNRYDDMNRGVLDVVRKIAEATEVWVPLIVLGELHAGFLGGSQTRRNEELLHTFLNKPQVMVLLPDERTAEQYGQLFQALRRQGRPIPTNDMWIAALAIQHNLQLYSRDTHFQSVPGLQLV